MTREQAEKIVEETGYGRSCPLGVTRDICAEWVDAGKSCRECWILAIMKAGEE